MTAEATGKRRPDLDESWLDVLGDEFEKPYMAELRSFLLLEKKQHTVYPLGGDIFNAFKYTPFEKVKVVILGQDPYHGPDQAHGLCFSVRPGVAPPPSLVNILKELKTDLGIEPPGHGCLVSWAQQGVFLLNTTLTVREHRPHSHFGKGWEAFTDRVIHEINTRREKLVFILWGKPAQTKSAVIDESRHLILKSPHPSPLSAYNGFFGCQHFSLANRYLEEAGVGAVDWSLPKELQA